MKRDGRNSYIVTLSASFFAMKTPPHTRSALEKAGKQFRTRGVSQRVKNVIVSPIKEMRMLAQEYDDVISFGQGIPSLDMPGEIKKKIANVIVHSDVCKYSVSQGLLPLREKIAKKLSALGIYADPRTEILVTAGAMEGVFCAIMTIVEEGDEVIILTPGFSSHIEQVRLAGGVPVFSWLKENDGWSLNIEDIEKKISTKTKALILSSPNNPTGSVFREAELQKIAELCREKDIMILCDDPYNFLLYDDAEYFSVASIPEMKDHIIACFSFSKEFAMTGYRLGYVHAAAGILNQMMKIHDACCICAPTVSQHLGMIALDSGDVITGQVIRSMSENRTLLMEGLDTIKGVSYVVPKGAYYLFLRYKKDVDSVTMALDILKSARVELVPGSAFGPAGEHHLRLSFGGKPKEITEGVMRLKKYFEMQS